MFGCLIFFPQQGYVAVLRCNMLKDQANLLTSDLEYILYNCHGFTSKSPFLLVLKRFLSHVEHFKHWHESFLLTYLLLDSCSQYTLLRTTKFECTWLGRYSICWRTQKDHLPCLQPTDLSGQPAESFPHISQRLYRTLGEQLPIHRKTKLLSYRFSEPLLT